MTDPPYCNVGKDRELFYHIIGTDEYYHYFRLFKSVLNKISYNIKNVVFTSC